MTQSLKQLLYLPVQFRLLEESVLTSNGGTSAQHMSLPYLPGGQILGAVAARMYAQLDSVAARWLFHSGALCFGDARLSVDAAHASALEGPRCVPSPRSFQHAKQVLPVQDGYLHAVQDAVKVDGAATVPRTALSQARRLPTLEIDPATGALANLQKIYRIKSAISPHTGASADGLLFAYTSLAAGLCLHSRLLAVVETPEQRAWLDDVQRCLAECGVLRFGKSRSAQYGKAQVCVGQWQALPALTGAQAVPRQKIHLHLLADLCAVDQFGQPSLQPRPQDVGLPDGRFVPHLSYVQAERYSPYSSYLRSQDSERLVIARGSVLTFELHSMPAAESWQRILWRLQAGLGCYLEAGLGEVALGLPDIHAWPTVRPPRVAQAVQCGELSVTSPISPNKPDAAKEMMAWLSAQQQRSAPDAELALKQALGALSQLYSDIKRFHGHAQHLAFGPTRAQWGTVLAYCKDGDEKRLQQYLARELKNGWELSLPVTSVGLPSATSAYASAGGQVSFISWLREQAKTMPCASVARIAQEAMRAEIRGVQQ